MSEAFNRDYRLLEEVGRGRFGTVFRCVSPVTGEYFAVKLIDKRLLHDSVDRECLQKEPKLMHIVSENPNILQIYNVYEDDMHLYMVMDLCTSQDLYVRISNRNRTFSEPEAASVTKSLFEAIAHCHKIGVAHRDVKPDNILFDNRDRLKLADFGSAEWLRDGRSMIGVVGTPYYVAPEVLSGREYNEKVDVWSGGVILYIMIAGIPPFYGESAAEIFEAVLRGNLRFPPRIFRGVSSSVKDLLKKMLCRDVSRRISAAHVLRHPWILSAGEAI